MNTYIETAIALALIFFVFSTVAYVLQELIAIQFKLRGNMLRKAISQMLDKGQTPTELLSGELFSHAQIATLNKGKKKLTSYIPAANFALAIIDLVCKKSNLPGINMTNFRLGLAAMQTTHPNPAKILDGLDALSNNLTDLQLEIEKWFDSYMQRVSGWYKNNYTYITRLIAIGVVLFFNLNIIDITREVFEQSALRITLNELAEKKIRDNSPTMSSYKSGYESEVSVIKSRYDSLLAKSPGNAEALKRIRLRKEAAILRITADYESKLDDALDSYPGDLRSEKLPFKWTCTPFKKLHPVTGRLVDKSFMEVVLMILGLSIGVAGISMGAPFWFDIMAKLVNVRRAGGKPTSLSG